MTAEQLWYTCRVYPEIISEEEAAQCFMEHGADKSYWDTVFKIVESLLIKEKIK
jgi:hypothetical protein